MRISLAGWCPPSLGRMTEVAEQGTIRGLRNDPGHPGGDHHCCGTPEPRQFLHQAMTHPAGVAGCEVRCSMDRDHVQQQEATKPKPAAHGGATLGDRRCCGAERDAAPAPGRARRLWPGPRGDGTLGSERGWQPWF